MLKTFLNGNNDNSKILSTFDEICQDQLFKLKTTGEIIREQREKKGLLLRQVASQLDMDTAILSKVERGERKASKEQVIKLAHILDLNKADLLIQFFSEKIAYELAEEDSAKQILIVAEQKIKYFNKFSNK